MEFGSEYIFNLLEERGVTSLYHANSVVTSTHFLREKYLLGRGIVEQLALPQSSQSSDAADRDYGIWFDVFVDPSDIHARASKRNKYGPVLFRLNLEALKEKYVGNIWVTKINPINWHRHREDERWFASVDELEEDFNRYTFDHMLVFRHCGGRVPLVDVLESITLDDPKLVMGRAEIDLYSMAYGALVASMSASGLSVPIKKRVCPENCICSRQYENDTSMAKRFFRAKV